MFNYTPHRYTYTYTYIFVCACVYINLFISLSAAFELLSLAVNRFWSTLSRRSCQPVKSKLTIHCAVAPTSQSSSGARLSGTQYAPQSLGPIATLLVYDTSLDLPCRLPDFGLTQQNRDFCLHFFVSRSRFQARQAQLNHQRTELMVQIKYELDRANPSNCC